MSNIHDIEKQMADLADQMKRMQVELEAAKAAKAAEAAVVLALQELLVGPKQKWQTEKIARQSLFMAVSDMSGVTRKRRMADEMQAADMAEQKRLLGLLSKDANQKYCVYCLSKRTNWACRCKCVGCPSHEAAVAIKVEEVLTCAVSFEAVLEKVEEAHCLVALFLGPADGFHCGMHFPEVYRLWRTSQRVRQISYYDVHWLRALSCLCGGEFVKADLWVVSTFQDEFSSGGPGSGDYLRFFFVCQATHGSDSRCFTMFTSKGWRRKYPTLEWRKGQAYYCECNAKYNQKWGCLVEFSVDGVLYYMRAPVPDARTLDMLAAKAEDKFYKHGMSAKELFNLLPSVPPQSSTFVQMVNGSTDVMKITNPEFFDSLAMFPWSQIMNMAPQ